MSQDKNLEGRVLRDRIAEIGFVVGAIGGVVYGLATNDNEGVSLIQSIGAGASGGAGLAYCVGTIVKPIYEATKKYKITERE